MPLTILESEMLEAVEQRLRDASEMSDGDLELQLPIRESLTLVSVLLRAQDRDGPVEKREILGRLPTKVPTA